EDAEPRHPAARGDGRRHRTGPAGGVRSRGRHRLLPRLLAAHHLRGHGQRGMGPGRAGGRAAAPRLPGAQGRRLLPLRGQRGLPHQDHRRGPERAAPGRRRAAAPRALAGGVPVRVRRSPPARALGRGEVKEVLRRLLAGELTEAEAVAELRRVQLEELDGRARLDLGRDGRRGIPEVVLAAGKSPEAAARLAVRLAREQGQGLVSRLGADHWAALEAQARAAGYVVHRYHAAARVLRGGFLPEPVGGRVGLLTAGTSDLDAADEARMVIEACGMEARLEADLGVAGLHRLLGPLTEVLAWGPDVLAGAAGLARVAPGVVAGLVDR